MEAREPESSRRVCVSDNQSLVTEPAVLVTLAVLGSLLNTFDLKISRAIAHRVRGRGDP